MRTSLLMSVYIHLPIYVVSSLYRNAAYQPPVFSINPQIPRTTMKYFHIQMTADSPWIVELGESLTHVMAYLATFDTMPYAHFTTPY